MRYSVADMVRILIQLRHFRRLVVKKWIAPSRISSSQAGIHQLQDSGVEIKELDEPRATLRPRGGILRRGAIVKRFSTQTLSKESIPIFSTQKSD